LKKFRVWKLEIPAKIVGILGIQVFLLKAGDIECRIPPFARGLRFAPGVPHLVRWTCSTSCACFQIPWSIDMNFKRTVVLFLTALMVGSVCLGLLCPGDALAKKDYVNGSGTVPTEGDPLDGSDSLSFGGGGGGVFEPDKEDYPAQRIREFGVSFHSWYFIPNLYNGVPILPFPVWDLVPVDEPRLHHWNGGK
jgi:hypothetical protein